jgi:hypothetical protein
MASRTQIKRFGVTSGGRLNNQAAEQIGGDARLGHAERRSCAVADAGGWTGSGAASRGQPWVIEDGTQVR